MLAWPRYRRTVGLVMTNPAPNSMSDSPPRRNSVSRTSLFSGTCRSGRYIGVAIKLCPFSLGILSNKNCYGILLAAEDTITHSLNKAHRPAHRLFDGRAERKNLIFQIRVGGQRTRGLTPDEQHSRRCDVHSAS